jgi:hypothetical protein
MCLLSYVSREGIVDKILTVLGSVYFVKAWRSSVYPFQLPIEYAARQTFVRQAAT